MLAFQQYKKKLAAVVVGGTKQAERLVNKGLFLFAVGSADFTDNYYSPPFSARASQYTVPEFVDLLTSELSKFLLRLYELGARRMLVTGANQFGATGFFAESILTGSADVVFPMNLNSMLALKQDI
ncbi:unnamed protein product [Linum tenue]|uniref:Uncharacterized protein n=1 Tax=Linum tenue TaxID=586396 RepID=A0AAV0PDG7_9ROSI|nr:unnamed protein product [Linum tenue]